MSSLFAPVAREKAKLRMALQGVSGGGKTLSALYIAYGMTGDWAKIALIDTEHERAREYASRSDLPTPTGIFLYAAMTPPYSVEKYIQYVRAGAEAVGADGVVIVDSLSHAWSGEGGVLEYKDQIANTQRGQNSYTAWNAAGKLQNSLVDSILSVPCHTICTLRVKQDYALQPNERGKMEPVKLGLAPIQRDNLEYEFDIVLNIARNHIATTSKDVTFLDGLNAVITPELGQQLAAWLNDGKEPVRHLCADCGKIIQNGVNRTTGEIIPAADVAALGEKQFGRPLCRSCYKIALDDRKQREEAPVHDSGEEKAAAQG